MRDAEGKEKAIQVANIDPGLWDYEIEVEPVLQVLCGKALEQARIEVIEEYEADCLANDKADFKRRKEAMLMQTQRMEARALRLEAETDRRIMQQRVANVLIENKQRREIASVVTRKYLSFFKKDTLSYLEDVGLLRSRKSFQMKGIYLP